MSLRSGIRPNHLSLIARKHAQYSIRGGSGLVFALASLLTGLMIAQFFIGAIGALNDATQMPVGEMMSSASETTSKVIQFATGADEEQASYLAKKPAIISGFLMVLVFVMPFLVSLGAFNQTSGDIANKGLRYLLLRTERINVLLGRFLGTLIYTSASIVFLMIIVTLYLIVKIPFYETTDVLSWMGWGTIALIIYSLPCVALFSWISCSLDSPFGSLVLGQMIFGVLPILVFIGKRFWEPSEYGAYLLPSGFKFWLFHPSVVTVLLGILAMLAFTGLFLFMGLRSFQKRDL